MTERASSEFSLMEITGFAAFGMRRLSGFLLLCTRKPDLLPPGLGLQMEPLGPELRGETA